MMKKELFALADRLEDRMFDLACQVFDHPELSHEEFFAAKLLSDELESLGFSVERVQVSVRFHMQTLAVGLQKRNFHKAL